MEEEEELQMFQLELNTFGKRNTQRFRILDDLALTCDMCKTPEARNSISEMTRRYFDELRREENTLNKRIDKVLRDAAKKSKGKGKDKKAMSAAEKRAKKMIDRFTSLHLGNNRKLKLKFNGFKKLPYVIFDMKF